MKILCNRDGRFFFVKDISKPYHTQFGFVTTEALAKSSGPVKTNTGKELFIFDAFFIDYYKKIRRSPQIIPLKDIASIISFTGIGKESTVIDAGTGSGALACMLANFAKKVVTYELRQDFASVASSNIEMLGLDNISLKVKSVYDGIDETNVDVVIFDLPEPWKAVEAAAAALKIGGFLVSYSVTTPQAADFVSAIQASCKFVYLRTSEIIERDWEVAERKVRPKSASIGHSGFLSFARRIA